MCNPEHRHVQNSAVFKRLSAKLQEWPKRKMFQIDTQEYGSPEWPMVIFVFVIITRELQYNTVKALLTLPKEGFSVTII